MFQEWGLHLKGSLNHFKVPTCFPLVLSWYWFLVPLPEPATHTHSVVRSPFFMWVAGCEGFLLTEFQSHSLCVSVQIPLSLPSHLFLLFFFLFPFLFYFIGFFGGGGGGMGAPPDAILYPPFPSLLFIVMSLHQSHPNFTQVDCLLFSPHFWISSLILGGPFMGLCWDFRAF